MNFNKEINRLYESLDYIQDEYTELKQLHIEANDYIHSLGEQIENKNQELNEKDKELAEQADHIARLEEALTELGGLI